MNVKIPNGMKSPTVIIVGQGTMDDKKNDFHAKRMDNLEKKLDQQYRAFMDKSEYVRIIERIQNSFLTRLDKMIDANKNDNRFSDLRAEFNLKVKELNNRDGEDAILKSFANKLGSLERSIRSIPVPTQTIINRPNNMNLTKSFDMVLKRMETLIRESRPRMIPSPS